MAEYGLVQFIKNVGTDLKNLFRDFVRWLNFLKRRRESREKLIESQALRLERYEREHLVRSESFRDYSETLRMNKIEISQLQRLIKKKNEKFEKALQILENADPDEDKEIVDNFFSRIDSLETGNEDTIIKAIEACKKFGYWFEVKIIPEWQEEKSEYYADDGIFEEMTKVHNFHDNGFLYKLVIKKRSDLDD